MTCAKTAFTPARKFAVLGLMSALVTAHDLKSGQVMNDPTFFAAWFPGKLGMVYSEVAPSEAELLFLVNK